MTRKANGSTQHSSETYCIFVEHLCNVLPGARLLDEPYIGSTSFSYREQAGTCWPPVRVSEAPVLLVGDRLLQNGFRGEVKRCGRTARRVAPVYDALPMRVLRRAPTGFSKPAKATAGFLHISVS